MHFSLKWADLGKMGENGGKCGKCWIPFPPIPPHFSWSWVHYGYVAGYIATHLVRVFLRPEFEISAKSAGAEGTKNFVFAPEGELFLTLCVYTQITGNFVENPKVGEKHKK